MAQLVEMQQISFNSTTNKSATFGLDLPNPPVGVQKIIAHTSADCYISFDTAANSSQSFKLLSANTADTTFEFTGGSVITVYALGASGNGTLYLTGIRD